MSYFTAAEILRADGHTSDGMCQKCWDEASVIYADGQGAHDSKTDAYFAVMRRAEDAAAARAAAGEEG